MFSYRRSLRCNCRQLTIPDGKLDSCSSPTDAPLVGQQRHEKTAWTVGRETLGVSPNFAQYTNQMLFTLNTLCSQPLSSRQWGRATGVERKQRLPQATAVLPAFSVEAGTDFIGPYLHHTPSFTPSVAFMSKRVGIVRKQVSIGNVCPLAALQLPTRCLAHHVLPTRHGTGALTTCCGSGKALSTGSGRAAT